MSVNLRTHLYDWHVAHHARMVPFGGWEMPVQYAGIIEEHRAVRRGAGLFDISHMARVSFHGADVVPVLEQTFTNSVGTMKPGQVRYGLVCNTHGGILDDVLIYRQPYGYAAVINASNRLKILDWLTRQAEGKDFRAEDHTIGTTMVAIQGPQSAEMIAKVLPAEVAELKYYHCAKSTFSGDECDVSRTGYTGEDGFEVSVPNRHAPALWEAFLAAGSVPCGLGARDTLRLEAAMPLYGHELNETIDPIAAGLGWAVKFDKDFIGKAAIEQADPSRSLRVGLELEGKRAAREGSTIHTADGTAIGLVCSGSYVPHLEKSIAMGYVPLANSEVDTKLHVDLRGTKIPTTVVKLPFYQRKK